MHRLVLIIALSLVSIAYGQWTVPETPLVDTLAYSITDTIYISTTGSDITGDGSIGNPVESFQYATQLLPFTNVQNYGLIVFLPGEYYPTQSMDMWQLPAQWQQNFSGTTHYKNISVLGEGEVKIYGDSITNPNQGHPLLSLKGSHIFVKNIQLRNSPGQGLRFTLPYESKYASHNEVELERSKHILIDSVIVDGVVGHGIFAKYVDVISVQNSEVAHTSQDYQFNPAATAWGGAIKFDFSSNITCQNNYVHENYGEGINLSLSYNSLSSNNRLHDNRASHIYSMNARRAIINNNLIYTTFEDSTFWIRPPYPEREATGISIRNEFQWANSWKIGYGTAPVPLCYYNFNGMVGNNLRRFVHSGGGTKYQSSHTDSIEVYNNVILNAGWGIAMNDANASDIPSIPFASGEKCRFNNIWIHHNTCYGWRGSSSIPGRMLSIVESNIDYSLAENITIEDNVFLLDEIDTSYINWVNVAHPSAFTFNNNVWNGNASSLDYDGSNAVEINYIPTGVTSDSLYTIDPSCTNALDVASFSLPTYLMEDYYYAPRNSPTNVGALEKGLCTIGTTALSSEPGRFTVFPNPTTGKVNMNSTEKIDHIVVLDLLGTTVARTTDETIDLTHLPTGVYLLKATSGENQILRKIIKE